MLAELFGEIDPGHRIVIWSLKDKSTHLCATAAEAENAAAAIAGDVYFGAALQPAALEAGRGTPDTACAIGGLWADIDLRQASSKKPYPPALDDALWLAGHDLKPSVVVHTGGGVHAWWLLVEPWAFANEPDRQMAATLMRRWQGTLRAVAGSRGWTIDSTHDLSRVMRLPGTANHKRGKPVEVRIMQADYSRRYQPDDFEPFLVADDGAIASTDAGGVRPSLLKLDGGATAPDVVLELLRSDGKFKRTWEMRRADREDWSASEYDMAIASTGAYHGWTDQDIANAIVAWRRINGQRPEKALRRKYLSDTILKARSTHAQQAAITEMAVEVAPATPPQPGDVGGDERKRRMELIRTAVQMPVARVIQRGTEAGLESYVFVLDDGRELNVGDARTLLDVRAVTRKLFPQGVMMSVAPKSWEIVVKHMLRVIEVEDIPELTSTETLRSTVAEYLEEHRPATGAAWNEAAVNREPFVKDGRVHIHVRRMVQWLRVSRENVDHRIYSGLRSLGWEPVKVDCKNCDNTMTSRKYWADGGLARPI